MTYLCERSIFIEIPQEYFWMDEEWWERPLTTMLLVWQINLAMFRSLWYYGKYNHDDESRQPNPLDRANSWIGAFYLPAPADHARATTTKIRYPISCLEGRIPEFCSRFYRISDDKTGTTEYSTLFTEESSFQCPSINHSCRNQASRNNVGWQRSSSRR